MARVRECEATAYYAPSANRRYLTRRAACVSEARAQMSARYPDDDEVGVLYWAQYPELCRINDRLIRMLMRRLV